MSSVLKKRFISLIKWNDLFQPQENFGQVRYIIISPIISKKNAIIFRLVLQNSFYFMLLIWVSKTPSQRFSYKFIFLIKKSTDLISYLFCWILSIKYRIVQRAEKSISVHLTCNNLEYLSKWSQISYIFFWFTG